MKHLISGLAVAFLASAPAFAVDTAACTCNPAVVEAVAPAIPKGYFAWELQAPVVVQGVLTADGQLASPRAVSADAPAVADAALAAVAQWRFAPMLQDGKPVAAVVRVPVRFSPAQVEPAREAGALARQ